jgi:hypothetical protein
MRKIKYSILTFLAVVVFATPLLVHAQAVAPITQAELKAMTSESNTLRLVQPGTPEYTQRLGPILTQCAQLGEKLYAITRKTTSTNWSTANKRCHPAAVTNVAVTKDYLGRNVTPNRPYIVASEVDVDVETHLTAIEETGKPATFTQEQYDQIVRKKTDIAGSSKDDSTLLAKFVRSLVQAIGNVVAAILAGLASTALRLLGFVLDTTTKMATPGIVDRGWVVVRDFMNLFFIVALIAMSIATIIRYEAYNYKHLLRQLIIMAILINFSKVIAETLIGFSDTLIALFAPRGGIWDFYQLIFSSFVTHGDSVYGFVGQGMSVGEGMADIVTKLVALTLLTVTFTAIALLMFVRLVGLWFLVMISPVAYALNILPRTQPLAKQWWDTFLKYLIWGPVAMFFFRISFTLMRDNGMNIISDNILNSLFISSFVWAGFIAAKQSGMHGSAAIISGAQGALNRAKKYGVNTAKFGASATGNYFWRGKAAGQFAGGAELLRTGSLEQAGKAKKEAQERAGRITGWFSNKPKQMKEGWIDKPNRERKELLDRQHREMVLKKNYMGDFDKEFAGKVTDDDVDTLALQGKLNQAKIRNLMENGTTKAKKRVLYHMIKQDPNTGVRNISPGRGGLDQQTYNDMLDVVRLSNWKEKGGREYEMPDHFMKNPDGTINPDHVQLKATRTLRAGETPETLPPKEVRADVPVTLVRDMTAQIREDARAAAAAAAAQQAAQQGAGAAPQQGQGQGGNPPAAPAP